MFLPFSNFFQIWYSGLFSLSYYNLASFCNFLKPVGQYFHHSHIEKRPYIVWPDVSFCVPTLFHPFQPKMVPLGQFVEPNGYFQIIWAACCPPWSHIWDILGLANRLNLSAWMSCSNLVLPQSTNNYGIEAYLAYYIIFGPAFASF